MDFTRIGRIKSSLVEVNFDCGTYDTDIIALLIYFDLSDRSNVSLERLQNSLVAYKETFDYYTFITTIRELHNREYLSVDWDKETIALINVQDLE